MNWTDEWLSDLFSDEKKFNLNEPNGWPDYWHDVHKKTETF